MSLSAEAILEAEIEYHEELKTFSLCLFYRRFDFLSFLDDKRFKMIKVHRKVSEKIRAEL